MNPFGKPLEQVSATDVNSLIGTPEGQFVEFKRDVETKYGEFCADVSAFANADGGLICYGIDEDNQNVASAISGVGGEHVKNALSRLTGWSNSGIDPRVPGLQIKEIPITIGTDDDFVILVDVPGASFAAPHQVVDGRRFFKRYGAEKQPMTVAEIRQMLDRAGLLRHQYRDFRKSRVEAASAGDPILPMITNASWHAAWFHVLPLTISSLDSANLDLALLSSQAARRDLESLGQGRLLFDQRPNFDGYLYSLRIDAEHYYVQVFRNGLLEFYHGAKTYSSPEVGPAFAASQAELFLLRAHDFAAKAYEHLGMQGSAVISLSLSGVRDLKLGTEESDFEPGVRTFGEPFLRNTYVFPDIQTEHLSRGLDPAKENLKPVFDMLWNSAGWEKSMSYHDDGKWRRGGP